MLATYVFEELRFPMELLTLLLVFLLPFAQKKREFFKRAALGFLLLTLISLLFFPIFLDKEAPRFRSLSALWYTLLALSAYFYARFCFVITRCDALFFNIAAFMSQNIVYCIYHCYIARVSCPWLRTALPLYIAGAVLLTALLSFLIALCFKKILNSAGGKLMEDSHPMFLALLLLFVFILICLFFYQGAFESRVSFFDSLAWLSGELVCIFLLIIQYSFIAGIVRVREKTVLENMLRSSEKYYELSKEHIAIINRKCHDLKHQLKALEKAGEQDRSDYIKEAERSINFYQSLVYTDNEALNTILAEKGLFCQEKNIVFRCSVDDVNLSFIRLPDLYAILGNAIDNAIEYVETLRDPSMRAISMRIEQKNMFIGIQIANPYTGEKLISDELPKTHKDDAANHGFGMKSIRYLAEKYGGPMEFSTAGGLFTLQILLPVG